MRTLTPFLPSRYFAHGGDYRTELQLCTFVLLARQAKSLLELAHTFVGGVRDNQSDKTFQVGTPLELYRAVGANTVFLVVLLAWTSACT